MNIFIITLAAILIIAFVWSLVNAAKNPEIASLEIPEVAEPITEAPVVVEEPAPVVVVESVVEPVVVVEPVAVVEPEVVAPVVTEAKVTKPAPKKKPVKRAPINKNSNTKKK